MAIQYESRGAERADLGEAYNEFNGSALGYVAEIILPQLPLPKKASAISVMKRENLIRADVKHSNGGAFSRINLQLGDLDYKADDIGLEGQVTEEDRENTMTDFDADLDTLELLRTTIFNEQEIRTAAALFNETTFTGSALFTDRSGTPWDNVASDAISHILDASDKVRQNVGVYPTSMIIGAVTAKNLLKNTAIKASFSPSVVPTVAMLQAQMGSLFGIPELIVGTKIFNSAIEGQDFVSADIWSDDYALLFFKQQGSFRSGGLGRTITWNRMVNGTADVTEYEENQTESTIIRVRQYQTEKIFSAFYGHLLKVDV